MRKFLILCLSFVLCFAIFGCDIYRQPPTVGDGETPAIAIDEPPADFVYEYDSYADLKSALSLSSSDAYSALRRDQEKYGALYSETLKLFSDGGASLLVPEINGSPLALRDEAGHPGISLMTCELYNLPWIWYNCVYDGHSLNVNISYPAALHRDEIGTAKTYLDVLKLIAPSAPSPSNFDQFESYRSIYEKDIVLANDQSVTAMICELTDSSDVYVMMFLHGALVVIRADSQLLTPSFWSSFSMDVYEG